MRLRADVCMVETEYGQVLLDSRTGRYWELNPTGGFVLSALVAGGDAASVSTGLAREYEVDLQRVRADVEALVAALVEARLVDR